MRVYKLKLDLPFLKKDRLFYFDDDLGYVYAFLDGKVAEFPLRTGLGAYLNLLLTEGNKYLSQVK